SMRGREMFNFTLIFPLYFRFHLLTSENIQPLVKYACKKGWHSIVIDLCFPSLRMYLTSFSIASTIRSGASVFPEPWQVGQISLVSISITGRTRSRVI